MARVISDQVVVRLESIDFIPPGLLNFLATRARTMIMLRTRKGVGLAGPFPKYSAQYARARAGAGRAEPTPKLWLTGRMLNSMGVVGRQGRDTVFLGFKGSAPNMQFRAVRSKTTGDILRERLGPKRGTMAYAMWKAAGLDRQRVVAKTQQGWTTYTRKRVGGARRFRLVERGTIQNAEKALYVSTGRRPRPFLGLTREERIQLANDAAAWLLGNYFGPNRKTPTH